MKSPNRVPRWQNSEKKFVYAGIHVVADFWFGKSVENPVELHHLLREAAKKARSTPLSFSHYKFSPQGLTCILLLAESHIAVHTWPEIRYMAIDIFTCGKHAKPMEALRYLQKRLKPFKVRTQQFKRGKRV